MKNYLLILISSFFLLYAPGCKKQSFDPTSKSPDDFIGTWKGSISTFKNNQLLKEYGSVVIYPDAGNTTLSGIFFMKEISVFHEFQFVNGTLYFKVENNDPDNPFCQNWTLGGYLVFAADNEISIHITGNECGSTGNEFIDWVGSMKQAQVSPDSTEYYNFAKTGNSWTYKITQKNGDTCQALKQINQEPATYLFNGVTTQSCGWPGQTRPFKWNLTPATFSIVSDTTISIRTVTFPINAKTGVVYKTYINNDTATVTLVDTSQVIVTAAGTFTCNKFRYTEPVYSDSLKITKTAFLWLNVRYGIIRQEVANPVNPTDLMVQELLSKNF